MEEIRLSGKQSYEEKEATLAEISEKIKRIWIEDVVDGDDDIALKYGFSPYRDLHQLTCSLPLPPLAEKLVSLNETMENRPFAAQHTQGFLAVQNRAFEWHPEEANMDEAELVRRFEQPWYDPQDFLLLFETDQLIGFCWTKIFEAVGEIYMVGIDPQHHGRSLGEFMTWKGFDHLVSRGLSRGMLYVESDNAPANAIYKKLGMKLASINRAYKK